jgi:hypothetical protein
MSRGVAGPWKCIFGLELAAAIAPPAAEAVDSFISISPRGDLIGFDQNDIYRHSESMSSGIDHGERKQST